MVSLIELYNKHQGNVSDKWELYLRVYEQIFSKFRDKSINLLEIGVQCGGSLEIYAEYFPNAKLILGCDIDQRVGNLSFNDQRIKIIIGDATLQETRKRIIEILQEYGGCLDIVIDDGSHTQRDVIKAFCLYFPLLREGGVYIIEDLHCSYWKDFGGGLFNPLSSINFLKMLIDILNFEHWRLPYNRKWLLKEFEDVYDISIGDSELSNIFSITFYNSLCIIEKGNPNKANLGRRIVRGDFSKCFHEDLKLLNGSFISDIKVRADEEFSSYFDLLRDLTHQKSRNEELLNELAQVKEEKSQLEAKVQALETELTQQKSKNEELLNELVRVYLSKSWRITRPLRWLRRKLKI